MCIRDSLRARGQQQAVDEMTVLNAFGIRNGGKVYFLIVFHLSLIHI